MLTLVKFMLGIGGTSCGASTVLMLTLPPSFYSFMGCKFILLLPVTCLLILRIIRLMAHLLA